MPSEKFPLAERDPTNRREGTCPRAFVFILANYDGRSMIGPSISGPQRTTMARADNAKNSSKVPSAAPLVPNPSLSRSARTGKPTEDELLLQRPKQEQPK